MAKLRQSVLQHLALAEEAAAPVRGPHRALRLAEEFVDIEAVVTLGASTDPRHLDELLTNSAEFRAKALAQFLRISALRPLFFHALRRFEVPRPQLEELLAPYPELRWTLEVQSLPAQPAKADWQAALGRIEQSAAATVRSERHSAAKREVFVALASIAHRAAEASEGPRGLAAVADIASLSRVQRVCMRFAATAAPSAASRTMTQPASGSKRAGAPDQAPASAEDTVLRLAGCMNVAFRELKAEGAEGQLLADAARLVRLLERDLQDRQVDLEALLRSPPAAAAGVPSEETTAATARALHSLWKEVVLAEEPTWHEVLGAPEGLERDAKIASTGFCRMVWWCDEGASASSKRRLALPKSALPEPLCDAFPELRALGPALRLATVAADGIPALDSARRAGAVPSPPASQPDSSASGTSHFFIGT